MIGVFLVLLLWKAATCKHSFWPFHSPCVILIIAGKRISVHLSSSSSWSLLNHSYSVNICISSFMCLFICLSDHFCVCAFVGLPAWICVCVCADVSPLPASLQQGVCIWSKWTRCCFSKGSGWRDINPFVFTLLTVTLFGSRGITHTYVDWVDLLLTNLSKITAVLLKIQA